MYNYNILIMDFLQYKRNNGYVYKSDEIILKEIAKYLTNNNINIITEEVTEAYARSNKNLHSNTIARNMGVFREFNRYLQMINIPCYQIPDKIYRQNHHSYTPYIFSYKEIKKIYSNLNCIYNSCSYSYYLKIAYPLIIKLLYQTGMRIGELCNISVKDYDGYSFILKDTKNGTSRKIMIPQTLKTDVNKFYKKYYKTESEFLFMVNSNSIRKYFKKVLVSSNIEITDNGPRVHDLRHTYVVHSIEKFRKEGKDIDTMLPILQAQLGHQSLRALSYYFHLDNDVLYELRKESNNKFNYLVPESCDLDE